MTDSVVHISFADKRPEIPSCAEAAGCDRQDCPGPGNFSFTFGLAGGGYGTYVFCPVCMLVRGKDCIPDDAFESKQPESPGETNLDAIREQVGKEDWNQP